MIYAAIYVFRHTEQYTYIKVAITKKTKMLLSFFFKTLLTEWFPYNFRHFKRTSFSDLLLNVMSKLITLTPADILRS
jgi:hypothetical protein